MNLLRRRHRFERVKCLWEPGIDNAWHRMLVWCKRCGETRRVYHGINIAESINRERCPF